MIFEPFTVATLTLLIPLVLISAYLLIKLLYEYIGSKTGLLEEMLYSNCSPRKTMRLMKTISKNLEHTDLIKAKIDLDLNLVKDFVSKLDFESISQIMNDNNLEANDLLKYEFYKRRWFLKYFKFSDYHLHRENVSIFFLKQLKNSPSFKRYWENYQFYNLFS